MSRSLGMMVCVSVMLVWPGVSGWAQDVWRAQDEGIRHVDTRGLTTLRGELYLASKSEVYASRSRSPAWRSVFSLPSTDNEITCIDSSGARLLVGTLRGIYKDSDGADAWRNVLETADPERNRILSLAVADDERHTILAGTGRGVMLSRDAGTHWRDVSGNLADRPISSAVIGNGFFYAAADDGLYRIRAVDGEAAGWDHIFITASAGESREEATDESGLEEAEENEEAGRRTVSCITAVVGRLYIGVGGALFVSDDGGDSWTAFPVSGLGGAINHILVSPKTGRIYCATTEGVFVFSPDDASGEAGIWRELYQGFARRIDVRRLAWIDAAEERLWALTPDGAFALEGGGYRIGDSDPEGAMRELRSVFGAEPSFRELQRAALAMAELDPDKVKRWRDQARLKALLPKISVGIDKDRSTTAEIYTSATKDYIIAGPDDVTDGWDVTLSWELGDLMWSVDQTSIDVRSRLTTQLRNDVLADLRRAYYERRRLQLELYTAPPATEQARFVMELRIQELTQAIDDLTDNYLSDHLREIRSA